MTEITDAIGSSPTYICFNNSAVHRKQRVLVPIPVGRGERVPLPSNTVYTVAATWKDGSPRWVHALGEVTAEPFSRGTITLVEKPNLEAVTSFSALQDLILIVTSADGTVRGTTLFNFAHTDTLMWRPPFTYLFKRNISHNLFALVGLQYLPGNPWLWLTLTLFNSVSDPAVDDHCTGAASVVKVELFGKNYPVLVHHHGLHKAKIESTSPFKWTLLEDSEGYLAPDTGRTWRILVGLVPAAEFKLDAPVGELLSIYAEWQDPLYVIPSLAEVQQTKAWWIGQGGPLTPSDLDYYKTVATGKYTNELNRDQWGYWGGEWAAFCDVKPAGSTGTPRNNEGSVWARNAIQTAIPQFLNLVIEAAHAQSLRPVARSLAFRFTELDDTYLWGFNVHWTSKQKWGYWERGRNHPHAPYKDPEPGVPPEWKKAHGWSNPDDQHFSVDMLHDAWIFAGDPYSLFEMTVYAKLMPHVYKKPGSEYLTGKSNTECRGEGWMGVGAFLVYSVTGDENLKQHWLNRLKWVAQLSHTRGWPEIATEGDFRVWPTKKWGVLAWQAGAAGYAHLAWEMYDRFLELIYEGFARRAFFTEHEGPCHVYNVENPEDNFGEDSCKTFVVSCLVKAYNMLKQKNDKEGMNLCRKRINRVTDLSRLVGWEQFQQYGQLLED